MLAAGNNKGDVIEALIASGADLHARNNNNDSALSYATRRNHKKLAQKLIKMGAR